MAKKPSKRSEVSGVSGRIDGGRILRWIAVAGALIITLLVTAAFFQEAPGAGVSEEELVVLVSDASEATVTARTEEREETWEEKQERYSVEARARLEARAQDMGVRLGKNGLIADDEDERAREKNRRKRRVRRFRWGAPANERGQIWNVPQGESEQELLTALLRVCMSEADGEPQDCVGIWQVLKNIRRSSCSRGYVRRITECEEVGGETMLSVIRRAQPHILAVPTYKLRNARAGWIRNLETDCEMPRGWRHGENRWDAQYGSKRCPYTVELARHLIKNELPPPRPGARLQWLPGRPITWGGRCESRKASCDDRIACARGLARITKGPETTNAFWCRPGASGCRRDAEPICAQMGYGHLVVGQNETELVKTEEQAGEDDRVSEEAKAAQEPIAVNEQNPPAVETSI